MSVDLSPTNEQFLDEAVKEGRYAHRKDALNEAVDLLRKRDQLIRDVNEGIRELRNGEGIELANDEELRQFMDDIKAYGRQELAKRKNGQ